MKKIISVLLTAILLCCFIFSSFAEEAQASFLQQVPFAQMSLPISSTMKWVLWVVLFGGAKTTQYAGLTILGVEGVKRLKRAIRRRKALKESTANS